MKKKYFFCLILLLFLQINCGNEHEKLQELHKKQYISGIKACIVEKIRISADRTAICYPDYSDETITHETPVEIFCHDMANFTAVGARLNRKKNHWGCRSPNLKQLSNSMSMLRLQNLKMI